ncbi:flagellar hook-associated protein FlgK [Vulgatibacter sp.]|uniref:flagellar hook-associated protein FlgK n=1 Tax=Vulgatibacter sp. TaxID=1971226 RepID=UPI00356B367A
MSNLLALLSQASSSLGAHQTAVATAGHNLQNAGVAGYTRQRATLAAVVPAQLLGNHWVGRGVLVQAIGRVRDSFLESQIPQALAGEAHARAETEALQAVRALDPALPGGLSDALSGFYGALRGLADRPSDPILRRVAVDAADSLAASFRTAAASLEAARAGLDARLAAGLAPIEAAAAQLADLNRQIRQANAAGGTPNDLLDARQRLQDELVAATGATPILDAGGDVHLVLPGGKALVSGATAARLSVEPDPANGGLLRVLVHPHGGGTPVVAGALGGTLGGSLAARDGALAQAGAAIDRLAFDLAGALNAVHAGGSGTDGSTGRELFVVGTDVDGAAARLTLDPAIATNPALLATAAVGGAAGDGANLLALIATERSADPVGTLGSITAAFGAATARAASAAAHEAALLDHLGTMRESVSGVSVDEELIELSRAQRAYEAVGKVIQTTDEMLDTLMQLK